MAPEPTKVTPDELHALSTQLTTAGRELKELLGDQEMWLAGDADKDFGPAENTAKTYVSMANALPRIVQSAADRLDHGAQVFTTGGSGFADRDTTHGNNVRK